MKVDLAALKSTFAASPFVADIGIARMVKASATMAVTATG